MKRATIKDVSEKSGFSITTVSRALNGDYPVKKETYDKIMEVIDELNFSRNSSARNLRTKKTNLIALVVADINNPYYSRIAKRIDDGLFEKGYNLLVCNTDESIEREKKILQILQDKDVDSIIISPVSNNTEILRNTQEIGTDIILLDRNLGVADFPFIGSPNFDSAKLLTEYLIRLGHEKILFVSGTETAMTAQDRLSGFHAALLENGLSFSPDAVIQGLYKKDKAHQEIKEFLTKNFLAKEPYTAIFSSNNLMTAGIVEAANELNIRIPNDISLVSFGEIDMQELISPKVTCIKQDIDKIAEVTLKTLLSLVEDRKSVQQKDLLITDYLKVGDSVKRLK